MICAVVFCISSSFFPRARMKYVTMVHNSVTSSQTPKKCRKKSCLLPLLSSSFFYHGEVSSMSRALTFSLTGKWRREGGGGVPAPGVRSLLPHFSPPMIPAHELSSRPVRLPVAECGIARLCWSVRNRAVVSTLDFLRDLHSEQRGQTPLPRQTMKSSSIPLREERD